MFAEEEGRHGYCENTVSPLAVLEWMPHSRHLGMLVARLMEGLFTHISALCTNLEENVLFFSLVYSVFCLWECPESRKRYNQDDQIHIQKWGKIQQKVTLPSHLKEKEDNIWLNFGVFKSFIQNPFDYWLQCCRAAVFLQLMRNCCCLLCLCIVRWSGHGYPFLCCVLFHSYLDLLVSQ